MTITQVYNNILQLLDNFDKSTFLYDFVAAYGAPKATIARLKSGQMNLSKNAGEILSKKKFLFKELHKDELHSVMETLIKNPNAVKHDPRFFILTDYKTLLAYDTKHHESLETTIKDLAKDYTFFLPLAGMEKTQYQNENPADVKAAEKMARLYDEIKKNNPTEDADEVHSLNVFLSRLLFCFFAEDTNIFKENLFTNAIGSHTQPDGSDLGKYLTQIFEILNTQKRSKDLPTHLAEFPYVNGGLFREQHPTPEFTRKSRTIMLECGNLDWSAINPDIFGSMIQAVVTPEHRGGLGMHYTSVPNIMKVIEPLFLNDLKATYEHAIQKKRKGDRINDLNDLLKRLQSLKIFDPACGSGNFLIIAYKELRKLEIQILKSKGELEGTYSAGKLDFGNEMRSVISLSQFYGIELDDFAHEVASLSLWLAEHQMNTFFLKEFGSTKPTLPLEDGGHIVHGNATRLDWEEVCPKEEGAEIYILGNPPYLGARNQSRQQKEDIQFVFGKMKGVNSIDYIGCWFYKGALFNEKNDSQCSFVSTNSICQGEQVSLLWKPVFQLKNEIGFAHKSFLWANNAKKNAAVYVIIVGIRKANHKPKLLFQNGIQKTVKNISPYLTENNNVIVKKRNEPFTDVPSLVFGNQAIEGGNLILNKEEKELLIKSDFKAKDFIRPLYGAFDYLNGGERWCIWIKEEQLEDAIKIPSIKERINKVREFRKTGGEVARSLIHIPYRFRYIHEGLKNVLILPRTTSERREFLVVGFLKSNSVITDAAQVIYDPEPFVFSILSSKLHMCWVKAVAGRLKMDPRYSNSLCYNTYPFPILDKSKKSELENHVYKVLEQREKNSEKTLAQLYDPDKMPDGLRQAHHELDQAVERCYREEPFTSDEERLAYLFKLYEKMIAEEQERDTLFAQQKKTRKKKKKTTT